MRKFALSRSGISRLIADPIRARDLPRLESRATSKTKLDTMRKVELTITTLLLALPLFASCISSNTSSVDTSRQSNAPIAADDDHAPLAAIPRINVTEADLLIRQSQAVIIDVRAQPAYRSQHIKGAVSIPEARVLAQLATLPRDKKLITYCT